MADIVFRVCDNISNCGGVNFENLNSPSLLNGIM